MPEEEKIIERRQWIAENEYAVLPTGGNRTIQILKDDALEFVYYYKKPIEDVFGDFWKDAYASGDPQAYYTDWEAHMTSEGVMYTRETYGDFLDRMYEYIRKYGFWKSD